mmetsp:Transcript_37778/g.86415  ORF Transcript_37778/g.86415 Transcript_37778/m.86415 type:complete len:194 (-) Transcript_37778:231-812(-)
MGWLTVSCPANTQGQLTFTDVEDAISILLMDLTDESREGGAIEGVPTNPSLVLLKPLWQKLQAILEQARRKKFTHFEQISILGWSEQDGTVEKGSMALISMLLKIIVIAWVKVLLRSQPFVSGKVWKIFWSRARRQWIEFIMDKEKEFRNIKQRESSVQSTLQGINAQLRPLGEMQPDGTITSKIHWQLHYEL